jgi:4-carboxymuconolactone decarboxylase
MGSKRFEEGLKVRKAVLGEEYVDKSFKEADEFTRPWQEFSTEYCWGAIWTRPGLDRRTRSLINVAALTALGKTHEVGLHVRGALRNGCTKEEIREVLFQMGIYAGVPAAGQAFAAARAAFEEAEKGK